MAMMKMFKRTLPKIAIALLLMVSMSGCWDNVPLDHRAAVLSMNFEPAKKGQNIITEFSTPTPSSMASSSGNSASSSSGKQFVVTSGTGASLATSFNVAQAKIARELYLGHLDLFALSTALSPQQLKNIVFSAMRMGTMDQTPYVVAFSGSAKKSIDIKTAAKYPSEYFNTLYSCATCQVTSLGVRFWQMAQRLTTPGVDIVIPYIKPGSSTYIADQLALYRHYQFITTTTSAQTLSYGFITGAAHKDAINLPTVYNTSLRAIKGTSHLSTSVHRGQVTATFTINLLSTLGTINTGTETVQQLHQMAIAASQKISRRCAAFLKFTQKEDVDPLGVGRMLDWQHPTFFDHIAHWHTIYPHVHMIVHVKVKVVRLGALR